MNSHVHSQAINVCTIWCDASVHRGVYTMLDDQPPPARRIVIAEKPLSNDAVGRHGKRVPSKVCEGCALARRCQCAHCGHMGTVQIFVKYRPTHTTPDCIAGLHHNSGTINSSSKHHPRVASMGLDTRTYFSVPWPWYWPLQVVV